MASLNAPTLLLDKEIHDMLIGLGEVEIVEDFLVFTNYPFEPSIAYKQGIIAYQQIDDMDCESSPPTLRIKDELIFVSAQKTEALKAFAMRHNITQTKRPMIWEWILEPFLDTELSAQTDLKLRGILEEYGLSAESVRALRAEVETQMLTYNFDTMLWEWGSFDASDVLRAMRTTYDQKTFADFYQRVMHIALLPHKKAYNVLE